ncbi:MAG: PKD domain-containing protein, partial [Akkermansiaceae bacterium]|nr:PKD domain-containing protein [Akkermansiaceae bacterium]
PVIDLNPDPNSLNVSMQQTLELDATRSYDPEGTDLTFEWSVDNELGADLVNPTPDTAEVTFNTPGLYTITVMATDADGEVNTTARE